MRAKNGEVSKATDLQQTPYPRVIHGRYCIKVKKAELKLRYLHQTPVRIEELKSFVGMVYGLPPPDSDGIVIDIAYPKREFDGQILLTANPFLNLFIQFSAVGDFPSLPYVPVRHPPTPNYKPPPMPYSKFKKSIAVNAAAQASHEVS
ncbi:hypothetical protein V496_02789 [Pseudogymnoascus sp. VKM F-4515 (FW-2607)]|nr:hypothetical protein V496_02789 [Pseudogymnoascus sp. VKM F-4515 (FW-2607)]